MKLTRSMRSFLETIVYWKSKGFAGAYPANVGQRSTVTALLDRGLIIFDCMGIPEDDERTTANGNEVPIYDITEAGVAAIQEKAA